MTELLVDFAALEAAETDLRETADRLRALTRDLAAGLDPLAATWTGAAASAYRERRQQWDRAAADLVGVLDELRSRLATARANHGSAVTTNRAIWAP